MTNYKHEIDPTGVNDSTEGLKERMQSLIERTEKGRPFFNDEIPAGTYRTSGTVYLYKIFWWKKVYYFLFGWLYRARDNYIAIHFRLPMKTIEKCPECGETLYFDVNNENHAEMFCDNGHDFQYRDIMGVR